MYCAAVRTSKATEWHFSPCCGKGICLTTVCRLSRQRASVSGQAKKRGWTIQHRPASITSNALLDSPGRATRKPAGTKLQLAGLSCFCFRTIHGGSGSEKQASRTCFSLFGPAKQVFNPGASKNIACRRMCLEDDCRPHGLEAYQGHIKLLHFVLVEVYALQAHSFAAKEKPPESRHSEGPNIYPGSISAVDYL